MGQVINKKLGLWRAFKWFFQFRAEFYANSLMLGPGNYTINVDLPDTPSKIWLYVCEDDDAVSVCQTTLSTVGAKIKPFGFILQANITGNKCVVDWFAEYR